MRPNLSKDISIESFKDFYWLKEELQTFCGENGISSTGSKIENSDRIETFLRSGEIKNPIRKTKINRMVEPQVHLSLDTFKKKIAPQFEYNQFTNDFFADPKNQGKSRAEAIEAWNKIKKLPGSNKY
ncbi:SAP domain-containing protein [Peribacillus simplex]|uniref:SAP domain-containing protein n=1 Tax=Peribacillus simplex TaxID=1478 RepID=UPI003CF7EBBD